MNEKKDYNQKEIVELINKSPQNWNKILSKVLSVFDCSTGTLHFLNKETKLLDLVAHQNIPSFLLPKMNEIPIGKGMAGIAAERLKPVEMCNLQTDSSNIARPAAKETKVEGSIAVPMMLEGKLYGVLGVGKSVPYDFTEAEIEELLIIGEHISAVL